ncbi:MAG: phosphatase PAP2 family protein [Oscillospiraceae bacterium]|nr:phosphatase PAP2 family protein [Oscillospiraceae bacterium]
MGNVFSFDWEDALIIWLQSHMGAAGTALSTVFSMFGEELLLILVMGFFYWGWDKEIGKLLGRCTCAELVFNPMLKNIALRLRPYMVDPEIKCLKAVDSSADVMDVAAQGYSFPSGHSANAAVTYGVIGRCSRKTWIRILAVCIPLLVGISRFCLGVHYPTDVLAGWLLGLALIFFMPWFVGKFKSRWIPYVILLLVMLPGWFYCKSNDFYSGYGMTLGFFLGDLFEEKYVRFHNTRVWWKILLRIVGGAAIYFGLNTVLKLPFSRAFLDSGTFAAYLVRALRYAVILFVDIAIYPLLFDRIGKKKEQTD